MSDGSHHAQEQILPMPDTLNEWIATYLGWKPPGSPDREKRMETAPVLAGFAGTWLKPDGDTLAHLPLYDTDPAAMVELLEHAWTTKITIDLLGQCRVVIRLRNRKSHGVGLKRILPAAVAEAFASAAGRVASGG